MNNVNAQTHAFYNNPCDCTPVDNRFPVPSSFPQPIPPWWQPFPGIPGQWVPAPWGQPWAPSHPQPLPLHPHGEHHHHPHHEHDHDDDHDHEHDHHHHHEHHHQSYGQMHSMAQNTEDLFQDIAIPAVPRFDDQWPALGYVNQQDAIDQRLPGPSGGGHGGGGHGGGGHGGGGHGGGGHGGGGHGGGGHGGGPPWGPPHHGPWHPGPWVPGPWGPWGGGVLPIPIPIPIGGGGGGVAPIPVQYVYVSINGGSAYPNATATYQVTYRPGLTIYEALASTGVIQLSPAGQILVVSGVVMGGNVNYSLRLNGRSIPASMMNYVLQPNDRVSVDLIYS